MIAARPSLLIVAHGARAPAWATQVCEFVEHVRETPGVADAFGAVEAAFLEYEAPTIPDAVRALLGLGSTRILVAPLFLTVSAHLGEDLPGLLGLPVPEHVRQRLRAEGKTPLRPGLPAALLDLGPLDVLLTDNVVRRLALRSEDRGHEAVVLCAYGSALYHEAWEALLASVRARLMRAAGFGYACHAYVGHAVGNSAEPTADAIARAGHMAGIRRIHVVPLLLSVGPLQTEVIPAACERATGLDHACRIVYAADAILPDGDLAMHVGHIALEALGVFPAAAGDVWA